METKKKTNSKLIKKRKRKQETFQNENSDREKTR